MRKNPWKADLVALRMLDPAYLRSAHAWPSLLGRFHVFHTNNFLEISFHVFDGTGGGSWLGKCCILFGTLFWFHGGIKRLWARRIGWVSTVWSFEARGSQCPHACDGCISWSRDHPTVGMRWEYKVQSWLRHSSVTWSCIQGVLGLLRSFQKDSPELSGNTLDF